MTAIPENDAENIAPMTPEERQAMKARLKARTIAWRVWNRSLILYELRLKFLFSIAYACLQIE